MSRSWVPTFPITINLFVAKVFFFSWFHSCVCVCVLYVWHHLQSYCRMKCSQNQMTQMNSVLNLIRLQHYTCVLYAFLYIERTYEVFSPGLCTLQRKILPHSQKAQRRKLQYYSTPPKKNVCKRMNAMIIFMKWQCILIQLYHRSFCFAVFVLVLKCIFTVDCPHKFTSNTPNQLAAAVASVSLGHMFLI